MLRLIVTSATYRQSSAVTRRCSRSAIPTTACSRAAPLPARRRDGPRRRLAASGLLSPKIDGPSVFPPQPPGIWNMPYNSDKWTTSEGEDRYRRSLYTFWRRTSPYPSFMTFDATSREFCTVRRVRTNTPLQALTLLNDPASFEAARALAARMLARPGRPTDARTRRLRLQAGADARGAARPRSIAWSRSTTTSARTTRRTRRRPRPTCAGRLTRAGDLAERAAWTIVANVLLNLDEAVSRM